MSRNWKSNLVYTDPARLISGNDDIIQMMAEKQPPIRFKPMQKWEYSNTGYVLLASIVSRASGMPFSKYLKEQIFDPVGMTNTVVYDYQAGPDSEMPNRVYGFRSNQHGSGLVSTDFHFLNLAEGDGGIYSTLDDLLKWDRVLYGNALISEASKKEAFTPVVLADGTLTSYGFGWNIGKSPSGRKVVEHGGSWVGFRTHIYREIEEDNCIILLTNNSSQHINTILTRLKKILHEQ